MLGSSVGGFMEGVYVECSLCGERYEYPIVINTCLKCGGALLFKYDLDEIKRIVCRDMVESRFPSFWKYIEFLPINSASDIVSLGEPFTPIIELPDELSFGFRSVFAKNDGLLPTLTFKARGMSVAVTCLRELNVGSVAIASIGNAAAALATYGARAGIEVHVFMPKNTPLSMVRECELMGANLHFVDGTISDAAKLIEEVKGKYGWFELSTNKQPYRFEGYKLMAYELAEQFNWKPPDAIVFPTGGGEGIIGLWKGFKELSELGWIESSIPKLIIVQSSGCAPLVNAFKSGLSEVTSPWINPQTIALGLKVPKPYASYLILRAIRETNGYAVSVSDDEILSSMRKLAKKGLFVCPEAAATHAALPHLYDEGVLDLNEKVLLYFTGHGLKYLELIK